jgi:DNA-binding XRE family transcriptional regulator
VAWSNVERVSYERAPDAGPEVEVEIEWKSRAVEVGERLRSSRLRAGFSQEQLGLRAGVSRNHVHLLETGRSSPTLDANPRLRMVYKLAAALGVTPMHLLPGDINMVPAAKDSDLRRPSGP